MAVRTTVLPPEASRASARHATDASALARRLPRLALEARRVAASARHGVHGRRRAGAGETFWQYRPYADGESSARVDWRRSARDDRTLFVREREWEAAHTVLLWADRSASMGFQSSLAPVPKIDRALVIALALSDMLVRGGERVGWLGLGAPSASRAIVERLCEALSADRAGHEADLPDARPLAPLTEAVLVGDWLVEPARAAAVIETLSARGARGHLVQVLDPVEETFPFTGQAELYDLEAGLNLRVGDAAAFARDVTQRMSAHRDAIRAACLRRGWSFAVHRTDRPVGEAALALAVRVGQAGSVSALQSFAPTGLAAAPGAGAAAGG